MTKTAEESFYEATKDTFADEEAVMLAVNVNKAVIELLAPLMQQMEFLKYPADLRLLMWETVARKANTYAERCK